MSETKVEISAEVREWAEVGLKELQKDWDAEFFSSCDKLIEQYQECPKTH